jgi:hypothetical protein
MPLASAGGVSVCAALVLGLRAAFCYDRIQLYASQLHKKPDKDKTTQEDTKQRHSA